MTAAEVIEAARDEHPGFNANITGDRMMVRFLDRYQESLRDKIAATNAAVLEQVYEVDLPPFDFEEGEEMPAHLRVFSAKVIDFRDRLEHPVGIRHTSDEPRRLERLTIQVTDDRILFMGARDTWRIRGAMYVRYLPAAPRVTRSSSTIQLPEGHYPVLVAAAIDFLARRTPDQQHLPPVERRRYAEALTETESVYLEQLRRRTPARILPKFRRR